MEKEMQEKVKQETQGIICDILEQGIQSDNIDFLGKVVDIHKDISNEEYWKEKEEYYMRYRGNYNDGSYGRGRVRDSRGRYMDGGSYGRRGVPGSGRGRYRGHDILDEMYDKYEEYNAGREEYTNTGNYGAKDESIESLEKMLKGIVAFMECLQEDADSEEEAQIIRKYARKISEM